MKGLLKFTKLSYQLYSPDDVRCIEEYHEIVLKGESEEDLLQFHADYINYHLYNLPSNSEYETVDVELVNQNFILL